MLACTNIPLINGQPSFLFESMLNSGLDRDTAIEMYYRAHTPEFKAVFGDWESMSMGDLTDHNGEPRLEYLLATTEQITNAKKYHDIFLDEGSYDLPNIETEPTSYHALLADYKNRLSRVNEALSHAIRSNNKTEEYKLRQEENTLKEAIKKIGRARRLEDIQVYAIRDLNSVETTLSKDKVSLRDLRLARQKLHTWIKGIDLFFSPEEKVESSLVDEFLQYELKARNLLHGVEKMEDTHMTAMIRKTLGTDISTEDLYEYKKDISVVYSDVQDISKVDDFVFQALHRLVKNKNSVVRATLKEVINKTDELTDKLVKKFGPSYYEKFYQRDQNGNYTGSVISNISHNFLETKWRLYGNAFGDESTPAKRKEFFKWKKENEITLDPNILKGTDLKARQEYVEFLRNQLGTEADDLISQLDEKLDLFEADSLAMKDYLEAEYGIQGSIMYRQWLEDYSPYLYVERYKSDKPPKIRKDGSFPKNYGSRYTFDVPLRYKGDKETGWYDQRFQDILADPDLKEFYEFYIDTIKRMMSVLPQNQVENMRLHGIPGIKKTVLDMFSEKGMKAGLTSIWDSLKESVSVNVTEAYGTAYVDPITGQSPKTFKIGTIENIDNQIRIRHREKIADYMVQTGLNPTKDITEAFKIEARNEITRDNITDLGRILKAYSALSIAYKHNTEIEDYLSLAETVTSRQAELETNNAGIPEIDPTTGKVRVKPLADSFKNKRAMLNYFINVQFGDRKAIEGVTNIPVMTSKETARKKELEAKIAEANIALERGNIDTTQHSSIIKLYNTEIDKLGSKLNMGRVGDRVLDLVRLRIMAWNPISATTSMLSGLVSNIIEGTGGQVYSINNFWKGYALTLNSIGKSLSFGTVQTPTAKKIRALMDLYNLPSESSQEFKDSKSQGWSGAMKNLHPYNLERISEFTNQAPVMIAIMLGTEVEVDGKKTNLWEAYSDTELKGWQIGDYNYNQLKAKIDQIVKQNQGNYDPDSSLKLDEKLWKRALGQFRRFMFEGFESRFGSERPDTALGVVRKGRYRSYVNFYKDKGAIPGTLFITKQLLRKMFFQGTEFEELVGENFTKVDAANMRKNMTGLIFLMSISSLYLLGKASVEDDEEKLLTYNWFINQLLRVQTDLTFYSSPASFEALTKNSVAAMGLISDISELFEALYKFGLGEDEIKGGVHSGDSRLLREFMQTFPGTRTIYNVYNQGKQVFDK